MQALGVLSRVVLTIAQVVEELILPKLETVAETGSLFVIALLCDVSKSTGHKLIVVYQLKELFFTLDKDFVGLPLHESPALQRSSSQQV